MTNFLLITLIIITIIGIGIIIFFIKKKPEKPVDSFLMIQQQLNNIGQLLDSKLTESNKTVINTVKDVTEKLVRLDETNKQVVNFADQLKNLQDILKNPKQRGVLGEYYLETVLKNVLPPGSYQMQYTFLNGDKVDAVVFLDKKIIPIDSKFYLENYNRMIETNDPEEKKRYESAFIKDLKIRIEETSKYIRPEEKTMDFAFMFIPSEAVYYDLLINKVGEITNETDNLIYYANKKKVIVVSPTSFLAYLQTVLQGLRNQKISEQTQEIIKGVERLGKHLFVYSEWMRKLGNHLSETVSSFNSASRELKKIDKDVVKLTKKQDDEKIEIEEIEKPQLD